MKFLTRAYWTLCNVLLRPRALRITLFRLLVLTLLTATAIQGRAQTTVNPTAGWNLLGNSSNVALNVATVFGDPAKVNAVWKWVASKATWAFYTPMLADGGAAFAASNGYDVLTAVNGGEGFWVNAKTAFSAQLPAGTAVQSAFFPNNIYLGWNLIAIGDNRTPSQFNVAINSTPPSPGVIPNNLISLWAWNAAQSNWFFYAPSLDASGALASYIASKGYLNFGTQVLGPTVGFWVNSLVVMPGTTITTGGPSVSIPTGTAPITLTAATPPGTFAALTPAVPAVAVSLDSAPTVSFALTDGNGNAIIGFGSKSQSATATLPSYPNLSFSLAKLVPGSGGAPSRWVSYIVTTVPTFTSATNQTIVPSVPTRPTTDNTGTLVDNGNGTYTYTFYRAVKAVQAQVAAAALTAPNVAADLDDLTYDPTLVHRLTIQISGNAPGTGTNTPTGVQTVNPVVMNNPINVIYDFIPATGQALPVTTSGRDIVATAKCNQCHARLGGLPSDLATGSSTLNPAAGNTSTQFAGLSNDSAAGFHGGSRNDARYCVVCHTEQRKYGYAEATDNATGTGYTGNTYRINGLAVGNLPAHIHQIHMGTELTRTGYNYGGVLYNTIKYPQDVKNCTTCHDGTAAAANATAQGDNWKNVPSRSACGACHDGINWATGTGVTLQNAFADTAAGRPIGSTASGHIGGAQADDSRCVLCHGSADIPVYHLPVTPPNPANALLSYGGNVNTNAAWIASNTNHLPTGAITVTYDIRSVSRNASKQPVMVFRMLQNGVAVPFNDKTAKTEIWDNFMGSPSAFFVFAVPQDGITAPADFNASVSSYLRSLWNGTATGASAGTLTGPDAYGYYTATLTGAIIPDNATMLTGGLGYTYSVLNTLPLTQTNLANYPVAAATAISGLTAGMPNKTGGLIVVAPDVQAVASGYVGRRAIVDDARCNMCHLELGMFTEAAFHAGQRNNGTTCSWCHSPNRASSGWSADSAYFVHSIHAAAKRTVPFTWHAASMTDGFWTIGYPGILKNCETCHLPGTYDYSAAQSVAALPNLLYRTTATGIFNNTVGTVTVGGTVQTDVGALSISRYVTADNATNYGAGFAYNAATGAITAAAGTTLVNSPITTVCFSCHDSALATTHMGQNGGSIYTARSIALTRTETCFLCHGAGTIADIKLMHAQ